MNPPLYLLYINSFLKQQGTQTGSYMPSIFPLPAKPLHSKATWIYIVFKPCLSNQLIICRFLCDYVFKLSVFLVNCDSGWQLNETIGQCELCPRGFYKDKGQHFYCQMCPRHLITPGKGATAESDCRQGKWAWTTHLLQQGIVSRY